MVDLVSTGLLLVVAGIAVIILAVTSASGKGRGEVKGGGVVLLGPIPIAFGSDPKWMSMAIVLAIALVLLSLLFYLK